MITVPLLLPALSWLRANRKTAMVIAALVLIAGTLLFVYLRGRHDAHQKDEAARAVAIAEALKIDAKAKEKTDEVRVSDAREVAALKEELTDAVADVPDSVPDAAAVALGCQRLRNAGADVSDLPACR